MQSGLNALAAFRHGLVGEPDNVHSHFPRSDHYLHIDRLGFNTLKGDRTDAGYHEIFLENTDV